mmetsp:Transcript_18723/g.26042  ORF Transcript_18723/g.26042 Transcript_18723/m.26042 type:complete len:107 (-) Transcript_18723:284-604(-)
MGLCHSNREEDNEELEESVKSGRRASLRGEDPMRFEIEIISKTDRKIRPVLRSPSVLSRVSVSSLVEDGSTPSKSKHSRKVSFDSDCIRRQPSLLRGTLFRPPAED